MANTQADKETVRRIREYLRQKEAQKLKMPEVKKEKEESAKRRDSASK